MLPASCYICELFKFFCDMKKLIVAIAFSLISLGLSAQDWAVGARLGATAQVVGQYDMGESYIEARFGAGFANNFMRDGFDGRFPYGASADFSVLYNFKLASWNWTPSAGEWFLDAGAGLNIGGGENYAYLGPQGMARFGIRFNSVPLALSFDWSPAISIAMVYGGGHTEAGYNGLALANFALTCVFYL